MAQELLLEGNRIKATLSGGLARFPQDGTTPMQLMKQADVALYAVKAGGRNRIVCASQAPE